MKQKFIRCAGPVGEGKHKWARAPVRATNYPEKSFIRRILMTASLALFLRLVAEPVMSADGIDAEADKIRCSTIYAATLPRGCTTVVIEGTTLHQYGGTYCQSYNNQYVVVYVD